MSDNFVKVHPQSQAKKVVHRAKNSRPAPSSEGVKSVSNAKQTGQKNLNALTGQKINPLDRIEQTEDANDWDEF